MHDLQAHLHQLTTRITHLTEELNQCKAENIAAQAKVLDLQNALHLAEDNLQIKHTTIVTMEEEIMRLNDQSAHQNQQIMGLNAEVARLSNTDVLLHQSQDANHHLTDQVTALTSQIAQLQAEYSRLANVETLYHTMESENHRLQDSNNLLTSDLLTCQAECEKLIGLVTTYESKLGLQQTENESLRKIVTDNQNVLSNLHNVQAHNNMLASQLHSEQIKNDSLVHQANLENALHHGIHYPHLAHSTIHHPIHTPHVAHTIDPITNAVVPLVSNSVKKYVPPQRNSNRLSTSVRPSTLSYTSTNPIKYGTSQFGGVSRPYNHYGGSIIRSPGRVQKEPVMAQEEEV